MRATSVAQCCDTFFEHLHRAPASALMLDYDGTLAPFCADRAAAHPYPQVPELLHRLLRTRTRVVLVTGRSVADVSALLPIDGALEIWGSHGAERRLRSGELSTSIPLLTGTNLARLLDTLEIEGLRDRTEVKPYSIAVHWRGLSPGEAAEVMAAALRTFNLFQSADFAIQRFDGGVELRHRCIHKGRAVRHILAELPESTPVAYLGDDFTDEDAFDALGQRGLSVLVRSEYRSTRARLWLKPPSELISFLENWLNACGGA